MFVYEKHIECLECKESKANKYYEVFQATVKLSRKYFTN